MSRKRYFLAKGLTGIGNRLLFLVYAVLYSRLTDRTALVDWRDGMMDEPGVNAFWTYFDPSPDLPRHDLSLLDEFEDVNIREWKHCLSLSVIELARLQDQPESFVREHRHNILWDLQVPNTLLVGFGGKSAFEEMPADLASELTQEPGSLEELQRQVLLSFYRPGRLLKQATEEALAGIDTASCLGVHVRATDKQPGESLQDIMDLAADALEKSGKQSIFLATDAADVYRAFQRRFGAVLKSCTPLSRRSQDGVPLHSDQYDKREDKILSFTDSLVELNCLASCKALVLQANSTFSRVALLLSGLASSDARWHSREDAERLRRFGARFRIGSPEGKSTGVDDHPVISGNPPLF